jgi:hypothetical protein
MKLLSSEKYNSAKKLEQYTDVEIIVRKDILLITMQTVTNKGIDQQTSISRVLEALNGGNLSNDNLFMMDGEVNNVSIAGTYFYPSMELNLDIYSDMVMNNSIFSRYLKIDENLKLQKKKNQVYCYFLDPSGSRANMVTANITNQIVEPRDPIVRTQIDRKYHEQFSIGTKYLRIRITRTNSIESLEKFRNIFSKLLSLYEDNKSDIEKFYEKYLGENIFTGKTGRKVVVTREKRFLKDFEPELFNPETSNYSRQCEPKFQPRMLHTQEEVEAVENAGFEVLKFPKDGGYVGSGSQHYYACDRDINVASQHTFPGVKINKPISIEHKEKYPVIPCCYKKSQKSSKAWLGYYESGEGRKRNTEDLEESTLQPQLDVENVDITKFGRIILGAKFLQIGQLGEIPQTIKKILESYDDNFKYYRTGVINVGSANSFLNCCVQALDQKYQQTGDKELYVKELREEIATNTILETIRQENYEYSVDEIRENILNFRNYFDPHRYVKLVEQYYETNIVVFSRINQGDTELMIPNHMMNYLRWKKKYNKTIIIYEHTGSTEVDVEYPHCELIVMGSDIGLKSVIHSNSVLFEDLANLENILEKSYNLSLPSVPFDELPGMGGKTSLVKILSQYIDQDGKTRMINIEYKSSKISLMTNPLPNLPIDEMKKETDSQSMKTDIITALELIDYLDGKIIKKSCEVKQYEQNTILLCNSLHVQLVKQDGPIIIIIGIDTNILENNMENISNQICNDKGIKEVENEFITDKYTSGNNEKTMLGEFLYRQNVANWLMEYNFWLFSNYCNDNDIELEETEISDSLITKYVNEKTIVMDNYIYKKPNQFFSMDSTMLNNGKLIICDITSEAVNDLQKRLVYTLQLKQRFEPNMLYNKPNDNSLKYYYMKKLISNYYQNIQDFTEHRGELIFPSTYSLHMYRIQQLQEIHLYNNISMRLLEYPYLLQTDFTNNKIVLCHDTDNLTEAYNIGVVWDQQGFNAYEPITKIKLGPFRLILPQIDENTSVPYIIKDIDENTDGVVANDLNVNVNIVAYKGIDNKPVYTTLLFL